MLQKIKKIDGVIVMILVLLMVVSIFPYTALRMEGKNWTGHISG